MVLSDCRFLTYAIIRPFMLYPQYSALFIYKYCNQYYRYYFIYNHLYLSIGQILKNLNLDQKFASDYSMIIFYV